MSNPEPTLSAARKWMAQLPRAQFDMLLLLTEQRYADGVREGAGLRDAVASANSMAEIAFRGIWSITLYFGEDDEARDRMRRAADTFRVEREGSPSTPSPK